MDKCYTWILKLTVKIYDDEYFCQILYMTADKVPDLDESLKVRSQSLKLIL